jgi:hypothetical protein
LETLPHISMTADVDWYSSTSDNNIDDLEIFYDANEDDIHQGTFDDFGEYRYRHDAIHNTSREAEFFDAVEFLNCNDMVNNLISDTYDAKVALIANRKPDFSLLHPMFGCTPSDTIDCTFSVTTQFSRGRVSDSLKKNWRSRFPAWNVIRHNEPAANNADSTDTTAVDSGYIAAQIFIRC